MPKETLFQQALEHLVDAAQLVHHDILEEPTWNPEYNMQITLAVSEIRALAAGTKRGRAAMAKLARTSPKQNPGTPAKKR